LAFLKLAVQCHTEFNNPPIKEIPLEPGELFYTNVDSKHRIMAVYAGTSLTEVKRIMGTVKATGKFPGAHAAYANGLQWHVIGRADILVCPFTEQVNERRRQAGCLFLRRLYAG